MNAFTAPCQGKYNGPTTEKKKRIENAVGYVSSIVFTKENLHFENCDSEKKKKNINETATKTFAKHKSFFT